jgi:hypothetical protein
MNRYKLIKTIHRKRSEEEKDLWWRERRGGRLHCKSERRRTDREAQIEISRHLCDDL